MLNRKGRKFFDGINTQATEECWDGVNATQVWSGIIQFLNHCCCH